MQWKITRFKILLRKGKRAVEWLRQNDKWGKFLDQLEESIDVSRIELQKMKDCGNSPELHHYFNNLGLKHECEMSELWNWFEKMCVTFCLI